MELLSVLNIFLLAILFENVVFARAFSIGRLMRLIEAPSTMIPFSALLVLLTTLSSVCSSVLTMFLGEQYYFNEIQPLVYIGVMVVLYIITRLIWRAVSAKTYNRYAVLLNTAVINCSTIGAMLIVNKEAYGIFDAAGFGFGVGISFMWALALIWYGKKALRRLDVPESFKGLPVETIYIGIISLALYGIIGGAVVF